MANVMQINLEWALKRFSFINLSKVNLFLRKKIKIVKQNSTIFSVSKKVKNVQLRKQLEISISPQNLFETQTVRMFTKLI